ncbi:hypothetical protein Ahy_A06g030003 [Arachis hypogaea]|uniref:WAT1-related protein n=1 Tax=Arachis hypogaea TaxID=3818 RepID=A0A445CUU5_ARAHY|nr:hypothetical protein Ahy_A06g030003 [Arachis hypogaea]
MLQALCSTLLSTVVHTRCLHRKGSVYMSIFKFLSIANATVMSVIFLGEALYLGRFCTKLVNFTFPLLLNNLFLLNFNVVGTVIVSTGFYSVTWRKTKEDELFQDENSLLDSKVPLMICCINYETKEMTNLEFMHSFDNDCVGIFPVIEQVEELYKRCV